MASNYTSLFSENRRSQTSSMHRTEWQLGCRQGRTPAGGSRGEPAPWPSSCPHSSASDVFLHLQSQQRNSFSSLLLLCRHICFSDSDPPGLPHVRMLWWHWTHLGSAGHLPISRSLITPEKSLVPYNVTCAHRSWGLRHRYFGGSFSSWPHPLRTKWSPKNKISRQSCTGIHGRESWPWERGVICHHTS